MSAPSPAEFGRPQRVLLLTLILAMTSSAGPLMAVIGGIPLMALGKEFGWDKTAVSLGITIFFLAFALCIPVVASLIRRWGGRPVVIAFGIAYPLVVAAFALNHGSYALLLLNMAAFGAIGAGASGYAFLSILPQWFDRRLGTALGIAMIGLGAGQMLLPLLADAVNRHEGWRSAFVVLAAVDAVIALPGIILFFRERGVAQTDRRDGILPGIPLEEAWRSAVFWVLGIAFFLISAAVIASVIYLIPVVTELGIAPARAAQVASVSGIAILLSRPIAGAALDHFSPSAVGLASCVLGAAGTLLLVTSDTMPSVLAASILLGCCFGAETDVLVIFVRRYFGEADFSRLYGVFGMVYTFGPVVGPLLVGMGHDRFGSYEPGLAVSAAMLLGAGILLLTLPVLGAPLLRRMAAQREMSAAPELPDGAIPFGH